MDIGLVALIVAICLLGGLLQGICGFGFGIVVMSLLPLIMDIQQASVFVALLTSLIYLGMLPFYWSEIQWRECRMLLWVIFLGLPVGIWGLENLPQSLIMRFLGIALIASCIQRIIAKDKQHFPVWVGGAGGFMSGALCGAFNMGGPPLLLYLRGRNLSSGTFVATLHFLFTFSACMRIALSAGANLINRSLFTDALLIVLPAMAAMLIGGRIRRKVPERIFQNIMQVVLIGFGIYYLLRA